MCIKNLVSIKLVSYTQSCLYLRKVCQYFNWFYKQPLIWLNFFVRFSKLRKLWAGTNGFTNSASPADSVPTPWINLQWWKDQILRSTARHATSGNTSLGEGTSFVIQVLAYTGIFRRGTPQNYPKPIKLSSFGLSKSSDCQIIFSYGNPMTYI